MQVVNRKERANAKWRFAGLYILSLAVPVILVFNSINMKEVDDSDNKKLLEQLRKRDLALAELSQLAATLHEAQQLRPVYARDPVDQEKYDKLRYHFESGVEKMKKLYYSDTALYRSNFSLLSFLEYKQREYEQISDEFKNQVDEEVMRQAAARGGGSGGGRSEAEIMLLKRDLRDAERTIARLESQAPVAPSENTESHQLIEIKNKARAIDSNIGQIVTVLGAIEQEANSIERKGEKNLTIKKNIQDKVKFLKNHVEGIKNTNNNLVGSIQLKDEVPMGN